MAGVRAFMLPTMPELAEGQSVEVQGSTNWYTISRRSDVYSCTCPAWRNQRLRIELRSCKHIRAYVGGYSLTATSSLPGAPEYQEDEAIRTAREEVLARALERYPVLYDRMEELFGLRMPEQLAYTAGFYLALSPAERARITTEDRSGLLGVATWFEDAPHARASVKDERLRDRAPDDPPEFLAVMSGKQGARYGFWYDDSRQLPSAAAVREGDKRQETTLFDASLLRALFDKLLFERSSALTEDTLPEGKRAAHDKIELPLLSWLAEVARRESSAERGPTVPRRAGICHGGVAPFVVRGWTAPADLSGWLEVHKRLEAYNKRSPEVTEWIAQALQEIKDGAPGRALFLGHELHWLSAPEYRTACSELLVRAYAALGRRPLAEILRAQYMDIDPSIPIFELPPTHGVVAAAIAGDVEELTSALAEGLPPTDEEIAEALANATSVEVANHLLDIDATQTDSALWRRLGEMRDASLSSSSSSLGSARTLALLLVTRGAVNARAYGRLLELGDVELIDVATTRVEIFSEDARGRTALHFAAGAPAPKAVRALIDRGADARAEDSSGHSPYESARTAWRAHPSEAGEIFGMLEAAGGGPKKAATKSAAPSVVDAAEVREALIHKPPPPVEEEIEWSEGIGVHHARFGDGVVEEVLGGEGEDTKLKIKFENETRSLLAKFVQMTK